MNLAQIALKPSRGLIGLLLLVHLCAGVAGVAVLPMVWAKVCTAVLVLASLVFNLWRIAHPAIVALSVDGKHGLAVQLPGGEWVAASVSGDTLVMSFMVMLSLKLEGQRFATRMLLLPDSLDEEQCRRLRVWLKWQPTDP